MPGVTSWAPTSTPLSPKCCSSQAMPVQSRYWTQSGWSSPSWDLRSAICWGVMFGLSERLGTCRTKENLSLVGRAGAAHLAADELEVGQLQLDRDGACADAIRLETLGDSIRTRRLLRARA